MYCFILRSAINILKLFHFWSVSNAFSNFFFTEGNLIILVKIHNIFAYPLYTLFCSTVYRFCYESNFHKGNVIYSTSPRDRWLVFLWIFWWLLSIYSITYFVRMYFNNATGRYFVSVRKCVSTEIVFWN